MENELFNQFEQAVKSEKSLIDIVDTLKQKGTNQLQIYYLFEEYQHFFTIGKPRER
ncbi:MAG TPA: hypothetical protein VNI84_07580 [Pyrinomonadaceae bacterium]|nr:hypothetical protein [Pyrinomonadaceae bacterium]